MSFTPDPVNRDIVISGFSAGIGQDPYSGPSDMKSIGLESIPNEASVAYATKKISGPNVGTLTVTSAGSNLINFNAAAGLEGGMAIVFSASTISGVSTGTLYYVNGVTGSPPTAANLYTDIGLVNEVTISGTGTGTATVFHMTDPTYFTDDGVHYWCVDNVGNVWTNYYTTVTNNYWTFAGNGTSTNGLPNASVHTDDSKGNGLVVYNSVTSGTTTSYLFVFSGSSIDYLKIQSAFTWHYGWNPATGATSVASPYLTAPNGFDGSHQAIVGPDGNFYYCDFYNVAKIQTEMIGGQPTAFNPTDTTTFTFTNYPLLPLTDTAQCISPLGANYLIGGKGNVVYMWDSTSTITSYFILLSENNVKSIVTVNTNAYIFVGNRGRIWVTNGSQAQPFKKIPDHISGTIDPLFTWGSANYNWNQLYFGIQASVNGTNIANYGGLWAIDLTTGALRNAGQLSYGTYSGYATAIYPMFTNASQPGYGLLIGWDDGSGNGGADQSVNTPYTGGQSWVTSELIPIGLAINPETPTQIEFKLSRPLVSGESVQLKVGKYLDPTYASFSTCLFNGQTSFSLVGQISGITDGMPIDKFQWIIVQAILTSTASSPSFVRMTELRLKNAAAPITGYASIQ